MIKIKRHRPGRIAIVAASLFVFWATVPLRGQLIEDERNTIDIVKRTKNSVVFITNIQLVRDWYFNETKVPKGSGSGFIWDDQGRIVTNFHVIADGIEFSVTLPNHEQRSAKVVGKDEKKDIAVLQIQGDLKSLSPITVGVSKDLEVGQKVIAIGNPFGFDHTVTVGIVSALGRQIVGAGDVTIRDMIQTDASINPGNSGGPLLNSSGELIGMNTMLVSPSGASSGVGFAVPVDAIKKIVPEIIRYGKVIRPDLPMTLLSDAYARRFNIEGNGVVIVEVQTGSEAARAGLNGLSRDRRNNLYLVDVITAVDLIKVKSYDDLYNTLENYKIGDVVTLTVKRDGNERKVRITLIKSD
ncbi:MAG: trypsin-like peptidase domain-containing protein [Candidatus Aminicenantales bacterium]